MTIDEIATAMAEAYGVEKRKMLSRTHRRLTNESESRDAFAFAAHRHGATVKDIAEYSRRTVTEVRNMIHRGQRYHDNGGTLIVQAIARLGAPPNNGKLTIAVPDSAYCTGPIIRRVPISVAAPPHVLD